MTVAELFEKEEIDVVFIDNNFEGIYWDSCAKFVSESWNREIDSLSDKQKAWLTRIIQDCVRLKVQKQ